MTLIHELYYMLMGRPEQDKLIPLLEKIIADPEAKTILITPHIFGEPLIVMLTLKNQYQALQLLLKSGIYDINSVDPRSNINALQYSFLMGSMPIVDLLLSSGIDVSHTDRDGSNALHWLNVCPNDYGLTEDARLKIKASLLNSQLSLMNGRDKWGNIPAKIIPNMTHIVEGKGLRYYLLERTDVHYLIGQYFMKKKSLNDIVEALETNPQHLSAGDAHGKTPLHYAVYAGDEILFNELLKLNASIHSKDTCGMSLLHYAAIGTKPSHETMARKLIEVGHPKDLTDNFERTPADIAELFDVQNMVSVLKIDKAQQKINDSTGSKKYQLA